MQITQQIRSFYSLSEPQLVQLARERNRTAFDILVNHNYQRMNRTALRMVRDSDDAEDVVQQTFLLAWQNIDRFRGDSAFSTWLTRIAMNESLSVLRGRKRQTEELNEELTTQSEMDGAGFSTPLESPEDRFLRKETSRLLREGLRFVKPAYRETMRLRLDEDLSLEEISQRLAIPVNTVKVHLFRGRQAMKTFLEERQIVRAA
ncbi:MAG: sigma-70 family RNA polymerase sigma factor [Acidobacteria bacterium]|nr:sigma-70 family RNA polymerase sigma factor [Acidobacteriota bacterium]